MALTRYCEDGDLEIDNNATEGAIRSVAIGRNNWVFFGRDEGGKMAFGADGQVTQPLWQVSFINPSAGIIPVPYAELNNPNIQPENGITGTPVIDPVSGTLYVCPYTRENGVYLPPVARAGCHDGHG